MEKRDSDHKIIHGNTRERRSVVVSWCCSKVSVDGDKEAVLWISTLRLSALNMNSLKFPFMQTSICQDHSLHRLRVPNPPLPTTPPAPFPTAPAPPRLCRIMVQGRWSGPNLRASSGRLCGKRTRLWQPKREQSRAKISAMSPKTRPAGQSGGGWRGPRANSPLRNANTPSTPNTACSPDAAPLARGRPWAESERCSADTEGFTPLTPRSDLAHKCSFSSIHASKGRIWSRAVRLSILSNICDEILNITGKHLTFN